MANRRGKAARHIGPEPGIAAPGHVEKRLKRAGSEGPRFFDWR